MISIAQLPQIVFTGVRLSFLLKVAGGELEECVDRIKSLKLKDIRHLASFTERASLFISMPRTTLSPFSKFFVGSL